MGGSWRYLSTGAWCCLPNDRMVAGPDGGGGGADGDGDGEDDDDDDDDVSSMSMLFAESGAAPGHDSDDDDDDVDGGLFTQTHAFFDVLV